MKGRFVRSYRRLIIAVLYASIIAASLTAAFLIRFDFSLPTDQTPNLSKGLWIALVAKMAAFFLFRRHDAAWRYTSIFDLKPILLSQMMGSALFASGAYLFIGTAFPRSIYAVDFLLCLVIKVTVRLVIRAFAWEIIRETKARGARSTILIYGAGAAGLSLLREIKTNPVLNSPVLNSRVAGFLDDDPEKTGQRLIGVPVLGGGRAVPMIVDRLRRKGLEISEIVIALPSATGEQMREALANCRAAQVNVKTIPSVGELLSGKVLSSQIRSVSVEDLLGRQPVRLEEGMIANSIRGRVVLVTGGGGSIGSELCRQVASFRPARLLVFERAESDLFRIHHELTERYPDVEILPVIGDIREYDVVASVIERYRVRSIFHAAAYKHVPMMEAHLIEAIRNNVFGTHNLVQAAWRHGVEDFLMISSDKAVNPTNVMGLTKRLAEILVSVMPSPEEGGHGTKFVSVRFGNVLGSNGSVVPLFQKQIAAGGPVTVTHPEMRRYFMTIREAVQLVLQASTMGKGSEIFVLDMGEPVKIVDLARNMIRLSGHSEEEIEIRYTGLRPGEKLFEELISEGENILPTYHEKIRIFATQRTARAEVAAWIEQARRLVEMGDQIELLAHMQELVPEYQPAEHWKTRMESNRRMIANAGD
jgi:FlaA1/EpsC-like NDP-sugar epimerase